VEVTLHAFFSQVAIKRPQFWPPYSFRFAVQSKNLCCPLESTHWPSSVTLLGKLFRTVQWVQCHLMSPLSSESNKASHLRFPSGLVRALLYFCGVKAWEFHWPQNVCYTWFQRRTVDPCGTRAPPRRHISVFFSGRAHIQGFYCYSKIISTSELNTWLKGKRKGKKKWKETKKRKPNFLTYVRICSKSILFSFNPLRYGSR
jgi:hypothetical protein